MVLKYAKVILKRASKYAQCPWPLAILKTARKYAWGISHRALKYAQGIRATKISKAGFSFWCPF